jgi:hypothetical protein
VIAAADDVWHGANDSIYTIFATKAESGRLFGRFMKRFLP